MSSFLGAVVHAFPGRVSANSMNQLKEENHPIYGHKMDEYWMIIGRFSYNLWTNFRQLLDDYWTKNGRLLDEKWMNFSRFFVDGYRPDNRFSSNEFIDNSPSLLGKGAGGKGYPYPASLGGRARAEMGQKSVKELFVPTGRCLRILLKNLFKGQFVPTNTLNFAVYLKQRLMSKYRKQLDPSDGRNPITGKRVCYGE